MIAEEDEAENRDVNRLGLRQRDGDDERAFLHRGQQQGRRGDLRDAADERPAEHRGVQRRRGAEDQDSGEQEKDGEGQAKQEPYVCGADCAERRRQFLLHGITERLRARSHNREYSPKPAHVITVRMFSRRRNRFAATGRGLREAPFARLAGTSLRESRNRPADGRRRLPPSAGIPVWPASPPDGGRRGLLHR